MKPCLSCNLRRKPDPGCGRCRPKILPPKPPEAPRVATINARGLTVTVNGVVVDSFSEGFVFVDGAPKKRSDVLTEADIKESYAPVDSPSKIFYRSYYTNLPPGKSKPMPPSAPPSFVDFAADFFSGPPRSQDPDPRVRRLEDQLAQSEMVIRTAADALKRLTAPPFVRGVISSSVQETAQHGKVVGLSVMGQNIEVPAPMDLKPPLTIGAVVRVNSKTMAIVEVVPGETQTQSGLIFTATSVAKEGVEVEAGGSVRIIPSEIPVTRGDRVLVNEGLTAVLKNLGKQATSFKVEGGIDVDWSAIGGQSAAKAEMQEAIEGPVKHAEIFRAYGKKAVKGILLYGPPGCGKTLLAKAAATSLAKLYGKPTSTGFIYVKGPEILSKWVGQSEETVRSLFTRARDHHRKEGYPAVLFIDEADAILSARGQGSINGMEKTIVPMFLAEMDGFDEHGPLVLLATNRSDTLDPAVVRDGRVDRKIEVTRPTWDDACEIYRMYLAGKPLKGGSIEDFAKEFAKRTFVSTDLQKRVCGALIAGIVDQAVSVAMRRDIASGSTEPGISLADIEVATKVVEAQNKKVQG